MAPLTRSQSRASSVESKSGNMPERRRSARVAQRSPSVASVGSQENLRTVDPGRRARTNAGLTGRLTGATSSGANTYGGNSANSSNSPQPESLTVPNQPLSFSASLQGQREQVASRRKQTSNDPEERRRALAAIQEEGPDVSGHTHQPEGSNTSRSNAVRRRTSAQQDDADGASQQQGDADTRPVSRDSSASSANFTRSWGDIREAAFTVFTEHRPTPLDIIRRISRKVLEPFFTIVGSIAKGSAMILGLFFSVITFYLLCDMLVKMIIHRDITAGDYFRERSAQLVDFFPSSGSIIHHVGSPDSQLVPLRNDVLQIQKHVGLLEENVKLLERKIPDNVILTFNPETGRNEIPDAFWHALRDVMATEGFGNTNGGSNQVTSISWNDFMKKNEARVQAFVADEFRSQFHNAIATGAIVDRDTFLSMVKDEFKRLEVRITAIESSWSNKVEKEAQKWFRRLPTTQLDSMATAMLVENSNIALRSVNYFSPHLGATVDPYLTSPTQADKNYIKRLKQYSHIWLPGGDLPPASALTGWEEISDCWCAAQSDLGQAQIGVIMAHKIYPTKFTVEHIPKDGTLDSSNAPRGMEVWAEIVDPAARDEAERRSQALLGKDSNQDRPGPEYVRLASFTYQVDGPNHVQSFDLDVQLAGLDIAVSKAVVRVTESWGREWTCLYRLRMHGQLAEEVNVSA